MRSELIDVARRTLIADLAATLDAAGLDAPTRESIEASAHELIDELVHRIDLSGAEFDGRTQSAVARFTLLAVWPCVIERLVPCLATDIEDAARLQRIIESRRRDRLADPAQAERAALKAAIVERVRAQAVGKFE